MSNIIDLVIHPEIKLSVDLIRESIAKSEGILNDNIHASLLKILELRADAQSANGARLCIFSMPKSASSFVQSTLQSAFQLPFVSLATTSSNSSAIGANPREQELDELAIIMHNIANGSYIAQHHTRASPYTCTLLRNYGIIPVICIRNIPDCMVSILDMSEQWLFSATDEVLPGMIWSNSGGSWPFAWRQLTRSEKLNIVIDRWAKWYLDFFISWKRAAMTEQASPLFVVYENDILNGSKGFVEKAVKFFKLNLIQKDAFEASVVNFDKGKARFNKGISGRGAEQLSTNQNSKILHIAKPYLSELSDDECLLLFSASKNDIRAV
ncbi:hypothetical protein OAK65_04035 [Synechococcus sp. AH-551-N17]|nr:hypothetical protein [Synechococcus sp. AH-551-N17]